QSPYRHLHIALLGNILGNSHKVARLTMLVEHLHLDRVQDAYAFVTRATRLAGDIVDRPGRQHVAVLGREPIGFCPRHEPRLRRKWTAAGRGSAADWR